MRATNKQKNEEFVQRCVIKHLKERGWSKSLTTAELWEHGVDIKVCNKDYSRYWLIEAKGDPSDSVKNKGGSRSSSFNSALGQILTRMQTKGKRAYKYRYKYGIAFPASFEKIVVSRMSYDVMDKLNLYIFLVDASGGVKTLNWRDMKKLKLSQSDT